MHTVVTRRMNQNSDEVDEQMRPEVNFNKCAEILERELHTSHNMGWSDRFKLTDNSRPLLRTAGYLAVYFGFHKVVYLPQSHSSAANIIGALPLANKSGHSTGTLNSNIRGLDNKISEEESLLNEMRVSLSHLDKAAPVVKKAQLKAIKTQDGLLEELRRQKALMQNPLYINAT